MVTAAKSGMQQGDVVMLVVDVNKPVSKTELEIIEYLKREGVPSVLVLNKIDTVRREMIAEKIAAYASKHDFDAVIPVVAKSGKHVDEVVDELSKFLRESEWFFPDDVATDQPMRQYVSEIIREKLLRALNREVPHGIAVVIEEYRDTGSLIKIRAEIICEKQSHKQIIIGKGGEVLKKVGIYSREELEKVTGSKIFLDLWVRVKENWREREGLVSNFGYNKKDIDQ
jgi:GTP-binding protein Era